ncbi:hypothetical protein Tco_1209078 [Tanacetum coccineum]
METKDTLSSCSDLDEQEIQQLQKQAKILKENTLNKLNALKTTIQHLSSSNSLIASEWVKRLNERNLQIQEYKVQEVQASDSSLGDKDCSRIVSDKGNDQGSENQSNTYGDESSRSRNECKDKRTSGDDMDIRPSYDTKPMVEVPYTAEYNVFAVDKQHSEQPECIINTCVVEKDDSNVTPDSPYVVK